MAPKKVMTAHAGLIAQSSHFAKNQPLKNRDFLTCPPVRYQFLI